MSATNGAAKELIGPPKTARYRPAPGGMVLSLPVWGALGQMGWGEFMLGVAQQMTDWDAQTALCLSYKTAPLHIAEFEVVAADARVKAFVEATLQRIWQKSLGVALRAHQFGYMASEALYRRHPETGTILFDRLRPIHPKDAKPWTDAGQLEFVKVQALSYDGKEGEIKLRAAREDMPAKGVWMTHDATWNPWYGRSALVPSFNPWRMKWMPGGAMETIFKWAYKSGLSPTVIRCPDERYEDDAHPEGVAAQDLARQMGEALKAGGVVAASSASYPPEMGGGQKWAFEWSKIDGHPAPLIDYVTFLDTQIQRGILIPDEVITHDGNTGGYSRSKIAALAFFMASEESLNHVLEGFDDQVIHGLVALNFGKAQYQIKPKPLLPPDQQQGQPGMPGQQPGQPGQPPGQAGAAPPPGQQPGGDKPDKGKNPWSMQTGPRGGHQLINSQTGKHRYGTLSLADVEPADFYQQVRLIVREKMRERKCLTSAA